MTMRPVGLARHAPRGESPRIRARSAGADRRQVQLLFLGIHARLSREILTRRERPPSPSARALSLHFLSRRAASGGLSGSIPCPAPLSRKIVERTIGEKLISLETGHLAKQASGAVVVRIGDTMTLVATRGRARPGGARLLPPDRRLSREDLRRGQVPRRLHQARGAADHQGDPDRPADRPADPAALPRVVPRRGPDPGRADLGRPPERSRRPVDDRRLGLAAPGQGPVPGPDRRGPAGADRRPARRLPHRRGDGEERPRPGRRQHRQGRRDDRGLRRGVARARDGRRDHGGAPPQPGGHRSSSTTCSRPSACRIPEHRRDPGRPAPPAALRPLRRAAPDGQADRAQARAEQRHQGAARQRDQGTLPGGRDA